jgi:hypothetical protein
VVYPIGHYFGLKDKTTYERVFDNPVLENQYRQSRNPKSDMFTVSSTDMYMASSLFHFILHWILKKRIDIHPYLFG